MERTVEMSFRVSPSDLGGFFCFTVIAISKVRWLQPRFFRNSPQHHGANFFAIVKSKNVIRPTYPL